MVMLVSAPSESCKELALQARVCFCGITCTPASSFALCSLVSLTVPEPTLFFEGHELHSTTVQYDLVFISYLCTDFIFRVSSYSECQELGH